MEFASIDLINSEQWDGFGQRSDHLEEPAWIEQFLAKWNLASGLEMAQLINLRTLLRHMLEDIAKRGQASAADMAALNAILKADTVYRELVRQNNNYQVNLVSLVSDKGSVVAEIAASFAQLLAEQNWRRVKVCHNDGCRWAFYDETRGNTRRWCSDLTCGNRDKVRRFRARRKKTGSIKQS